MTVAHLLVKSCLVLRSRKMILTKTEIEQKREDLCRVLVEINTKAALRGRE